MNIIAGGFYDGLMLYVHALNETMLASGIRPSGKKVTKRMWNRTFHVCQLHAEEHSFTPDLFFLSGKQQIQPNVLVLMFCSPYLTAHFWTAVAGADVRFPRSPSRT
ncbi:hypothetical protein GOODEAATRI_027368 [Goodea atripinnis]|uniref:Uncharacterized protein n=1 Tax=Goodea atripinnis TaxID=208336 RepID=A0ABV0N5P3_9TELE